ncbi:chromate efflux transporter [Congregicoccus parvus]|uniref:chromate efflux transporter n=1 Tax=Congregicoccus parvus TaxID=3081749 RepID=UPI003FA5B997
MTFSSKSTDTRPDGASPVGGRRGEIFRAFLRLGCISFGGPVAHIGYLREEFVVRRRWLDEAAYADLVALCQFLPGPASSQVVFALGMMRGGLLGALTASFCFTLPSAVMMIAFAYGVTALGDLAGAGWLHGLKTAAVAVVAQAVWGMGRKLCPDRARIALALGAAIALLVVPGTVGQVAVIVLGAVVGWWTYRGAVNREERGTEPGRSTGHGWAVAALIVFGVLLVGLPVVAASTEWRSWDVVDSFYRAGSLVFGGGHVILPLLRAEVVPPGWLADDAFLAGYGAAQAVPGPLFTLAGFLGAAIPMGLPMWAGGLVGLSAIFLPAWLLVGGTFPFWRRLREQAWSQAALRGANAAVVGVLLAALYDPVWREGVKGPVDVAGVIGAFLMLEVFRVPAWVVVVLAAGVGQWVG